LAFLGTDKAEPTQTSTMIHKKWKGESINPMKKVDFRKIT